MKDRVHIEAHAPRSTPRSSAWLILWALLALGCNVEVLPDTRIPFVGTIDGSSGAYLDLDALDAADSETEVEPLGFVITRISPESASPLGGQKVTIDGNDFSQGDRVFFGEVEAAELRFHGPSRLFAITPAHSPARVDLHVQHVDGVRATAALAFRFGFEPLLDSVAPTYAPVHGGSLVSVRFDEVEEGARLVLGDRLVQPGFWQDPWTYTGILPPLAPGPNQLFVVTAAKTWSFKDAIYGIDNARVDRVEPMTLPADTGGAIVLLGRGLQPGSRAFLDGVELPLEALRDDGTRARVSIPPGTPGARSLELITLERVLSLPDAIQLSNPSGLAGLGSVFPASAGSDSEAIIGVGLLGALSAGDIAGVTVCGQDAPIAAAHGQSLFVRLPPGAPALCDVEVETGAGEVFRRAGAFRFEPRGPVVDQLAPEEGPAEGGVRLRIHGVLGDDVEAATLCGLPLDGLSQLDPETWEATTPTLSPGACPLRLRVAGAVYDTGARFVARAGQRELLAVSPDIGSWAGGGLLRVIGTDLPPLDVTELSLGQRRVEVLAHESTQLLARIPRGSSLGSVDVALDVFDLKPEDGAGEAGAVDLRLPRAFTYRDPGGTETGTSGAKIRETINISVIHSQTREPVPGVSLSLRQNDGSWLRARSDDRGQAVISELDLRGAVDVSATREGFTGYTYAGIDAQDVVLAIYAAVPAPPSSGDPPDPPVFEPARIQGQVLGIDKYVPPPIARCVEDLETGLCAPCDANEDCRGAQRCLPVLDFGDFCLLDCFTASEETCPEGYGCLGATDDQPVCYPTLGEPGTFCYAGKDISSARPEAPNDEHRVDAEGRFFIDGVRLGDVAVICIAGYERHSDGQFVGRVMGFARHLFTISGGLLEGVRVLLDTALTESPLFELTGYVDGPGAFTSLDAWATLDLGSDGAFAFPERPQQLGDKRLRFPGVPAVLEGSIYDAELSFFLHGDHGGSAYAPYAEAYRLGLKGFAQDRYYRLDDALGGLSAEAAELSVRLNFTGISSPGAGPGARPVLAVTDDGRVLRYEFGAWYAEPLPRDGALRGIARRVVNGDDRVAVVGDDGALLLKQEGAWHRHPSLGERALHGVAWLDDEALVLVGDHRIYDGPINALVEHKIPDYLRAVVVDASGEVWAVGDRGVIYRRQEETWRRLHEGTKGALRALAVTDFGLVAGGDSGELLRLLSGGGVEALADLGRPIRSIERLSGVNERLAVGLEGRLAVWDNLGVEEIALDEDFVVTGTASVDGRPLLAVGATPLTLGPLFPPVEPTNPARLGSFRGRTLTWTYAGAGVPSSFQYFALFDYFGQIAWTVLTGADARSVVFPPLDTWGEADPLNRPAMRMQMNRSLVDGFDINQTQGFSTTIGNRRAVLYDYFEFIREP